MEKLGGSVAHDDDCLINQFRFPGAVLLDPCAELGPASDRPT